MNGKKIILALCLAAAGSSNVQARGGMGAALVGVVTGGACEQLAQRAPLWASIPGSVALLVAQFAGLHYSNTFSGVYKMGGTASGQTALANGIVSYSMTLISALALLWIEEEYAAKKGAKIKNQPRAQGTV